MKRFEAVEGVVAQLDEDNIDTDALIPARFLRSQNENLGKYLFANARFDEAGVERPQFVLNKPEFRASRIILAKENFGCGSSREAAVWALTHFGIECVIARSFGEIFYENCFKSGLLPIVIGQRQEDIIRGVLNDDPIAKMTVDLERSVLGFAASEEIPFNVSATRRTKLLEGIDDIQLTLKYVEAIEHHERCDMQARPWVYFLS